MCEGDDYQFRLVKTRVDDEKTFWMLGFNVSLSLPLSERERGEREREREVLNERERLRNKLRGRERLREGGGESWE